MSKTRSRAQRLLAAALVAGLATGCSSSTGDAQPAAAPAGTAASAAASSVPSASAGTEAGDIRVKVVDRAGYDAVLANHWGQVVLVDFWATWCAPCVAQFPHSVELATRHKDKRLAVVSVSCDEPTEINNIRDFLRSKNAGALENLVSDAGGSPRTMEAFEIPNGSLPHYKLYDSKGELRQTFGLDLTADRPFTMEDIDDAVEKLLAE